MQVFNHFEKKELAKFCRENTKDTRERISSRILAA
jgi:hypothetical protein